MDNKCLDGSDKQKITLYFSYREKGARRAISGSRVRDGAHEGLKDPTDRSQGDSGGFEVGMKMLFLSALSCSPRWS
jgi:hypothetical protein